MAFPQKVFYMSCSKFMEINGKMKRNQAVYKWTTDKKVQHEPEQTQFTILDQHGSFKKQAYYS